MDEDFEEAVSSLILKKNLSATQAVKAGGRKNSRPVPGYGIRTDSAVKSAMFSTWYNAYIQY